MAYTKQTWNNGDIITADKLNHMEDGIMENGGNITIFNLDEENDQIDATWQEIFDAFSRGPVYLRMIDLKSNEIIMHIVTIVKAINAERYEVTDVFGNGDSAHTLKFVAESRDSYPVVG